MLPQKSDWEYGLKIGKISVSKNLMLDYKLKPAEAVESLS